MGVPTRINFLHIRLKLSLMWRNIHDQIFYFTFLFLLFFSFLHFCRSILLKLFQIFNNLIRIRWKNGQGFRCKYSLNSLVNHLSYRWLFEVKINLENMRILKHWLMFPGMANVIHQTAISIVQKVRVTWFIHRRILNRK